MYDVIERKEKKKSKRLKPGQEAEQQRKENELKTPKDKQDSHTDTQRENTEEM